MLSLIALGTSQFNKETHTLHGVTGEVAKNWLLYHALIYLRHVVTPEVLALVVELRNLVLAASFPREAGMFVGLATDTEARAAAFTLAARRLTVSFHAAFPGVGARLVTPNLHSIAEHMGEMIALVFL
jgi:hypothetical protein